MKRRMWYLLVLFLILLPLSASSQSVNSTTANRTTCPLDFSYVPRIPFNSSSCKSFDPQNKKDATQNVCCQTIQSLFGIGLAQYLKATDVFLLPNIATSTSCLQILQSSLTSLSLPSNIVSYCLNPSQFVTSPSFCAGIENSQDWTSKLNQTSAFDSDCSVDLTSPSSCNACSDAALKIYAQLMTLDGNATHSGNCFLFTELYAAAAFNNEPGSDATMACIFGLSTNTEFPIASTKKSNVRNTLVIAIVLATSGLLGIILGIVLYILRKKTVRKPRKHSETVRNAGTEGGQNESELPMFSLRRILDATNNFSVANKLGEGGFGPVYKGILPENQEVAIKRLSKKSGQGYKEFMNELKLIAKLQHTNLVRLLGCCIEEEELILIYEYMPNRSLDKFLFDPSENTRLDWSKRFQIIEGIAQGVLYIHKHSRLKIIHRDLKASNILLDGDMNPKISDFGMAKIFDMNQTEADTNRIVGTYGYMSPEYARYGHFSEKLDVFSFGVLLLEIVSGKKNGAFHHLEHSPTLAGWAWKLWKEGKGLEVIDASVRKTCLPHEALKCIHVAFLCVQETPADRPAMSSIVHMLVNEATSLALFKEPAYSSTETTFTDTASSPSNKLTITMPEGR